MRKVAMAPRPERRVALVTGASRGIGEGIARRLAADGVAVVLAARSLERLEALAQELREGGAEAHALAVDLEEAEELDARLETLPEEFAAVDILVNNAGITADKLLVRMSLEEWRSVLEVNLTGAFALSRLLARGMMRRRWGRIISISSVVGLMGNPGQSNYAAAKAGLIGFTKSVARELASRGITANVVAPGYIDTAMTEALAVSSREKLIDAIPVGRVGTVEEIAAAAAYLASEEAAYITGQVLNVSGGLYL